MPDWLDNTPSDRVRPLRGTVEQFSTILDSEIGLALKSIKRLPDPFESAVGLSAQCSSSVIDSGPYISPSLAQYGLISSKAGSKLDPTPLVS